MERIDQYLQRARAECALDYAKLEVERHRLRITLMKEHPEWSFFWSTPTKLHMSSLLYIASMTNTPILKSSAASELGISRQASGSILDQAYGAGWCHKNQFGYYYTEALVQSYAENIVTILLDLSTNLTASLMKVRLLHDALSTQLTLSKIN